MKPTHFPKKHLGQNFLKDPRIQNRIIEFCQLSKEDIVLEIGPGQGAITRLIAPNVKRLICVETDKDLIGKLNEEFTQDNIEIIHDDFLKLDFNELPKKIKIIGNIPYYISSPIIEKLIEHRDHFTQAFLTVQLEFGQRLASPAGSKEYGSLSCFAQYHAQTKVLFKIKNSCFYPVPKVDSCFVCLDFAKAPAYNVKDEQFLFKIIRTAFTQRRKTFVNAASSLASKDKMFEILNALKISLNTRPEELNLQNFVDISNMLV